MLLFRFVREIHVVYRCITRTLPEHARSSCVWLAAIGEKMNTKLCLPKQLHLGYNLSFVSFDMIHSGDKCHYDRLEVRQTLKHDKGPHVQVY